MRTPHRDEREARQTARYLVALRELEAYADSHRFEGPGSFHAWERLNVLIGRLRYLFDAYELEGSVGPVREAVEQFQADLEGCHVRPDAGLVFKLGQFLADLEQPPSVAVLTTRIPPPVGARWPEHYMTVRPEELQALIAERQAPSPYPPGA